MDTGEDSRIGELLGAIKSQRWERGVSAQRFPETHEEYMELPLEERLRMAKEMMVRYADITDHDLDSPKAASATIETDDPAVVLEAKVGFVEATWLQQGKRSIPHEWAHRPARLLVGVRAVNSQDGLTSYFDELGSIEFDENDKREPRRPIATRPKTSWGDEAPIGLEEPLSADMIEIIDATAKKLIENEIARDRKFIGETALTGAADA